jgi:hypothetical protein
MDKLSGDLKIVPSAIANTSNKLDTKSVATKQGYSFIKKNKNISGKKELKKRNVVEVDNQFCKLSVTRSDSYKKALDLLIVALKQKSEEVYNEITLRRRAHAILQLHLPKNQKKAKKRLAEILSDTKILLSIADNHKKGCIELAYDYFLDNKSIPESFLQNEIYQYLVDQWFADLEDSNEDKLKMIRQHAISVGIKTAKDFTFKRFLRLKKYLIQYYGIPVNVSASFEETSIQEKTGAIALVPPKQSKYYLDNLDKEFIKKQITNNTYTKIKNFDLINRIKRKVLHSKREVSINALAILVGGLIGSAFTFGASFIFSVSFGIAWILLLKPITALYKYVQYIHHNNKVQQKKLLIDDINSLTVENKKELKQFINSYVHICKYDSMANLIGCFSELEKSAAELKKMQHNKNNDLKHDIKYEQQKVIYQLRKQDLQQHLAGFINSTTDIINTAKPNILELKNNLDHLWNKKFEHLSAIKQQSIFLKVLNKKSMASYKDKLLANNSNLMNKVLPFLANNNDSEAMAKTAIAEINKLADEETQSNKEAAISKVSGILQDAKSIFKGMSFSFMMSRFKMLNFYLVRGAVYLKNQIPIFISELKNPISFGIDWMLIIIFTALGVGVDKINNRINQRKIAKYQRNEKATTGVIVTREQTLREELYLLQQDTINSLEKIPKQMQEFFERCDNLKQQILAVANIEAMDDEQAAELFIQYMCLKQELEENLLQAFGDFYQNVLTRVGSIEESVLQHDICEF